MNRGCFYCYIPKKRYVRSLLSLQNTTKKGLYNRINNLFHNYNNNDKHLKNEYQLPKNYSLIDSNVYHDEISDTSIFILPSCAFYVTLGLLKVTKHFYRQRPYFYWTKKGIIVLLGDISNLSDICSRMTGFGKKDERLIFEGDCGNLAAKAILRLFIEEKGKDPLLVLAELQGNYAFLIYDIEDKQVFAARGPGGKHSLYVSKDEKGISFVNHPKDIPSTSYNGQWQEIPPGHYICGRKLNIKPFILSFNELIEREYINLIQPMETIIKDDNIQENKEIGLIKKISRSFHTSINRNFKKQDRVYVKDNHFDTELLHVSNYRC